MDIPAMDIPPGSGPSIVIGWLLVAALVGGWVIFQMMRRRIVPVTPAVAAFSMGVGGLVLFPAPLMNLPSIALFKWLLIFVLADMVLMSLVMRFQTKK